MGAPTGVPAFPSPPVGAAEGSGVQGANGGERWEAELRVGMLRGGLCCPPHLIYGGGGGVTSPQWGERRRRRKPGQHRGRVALRTQFGLRVFSSDAHLVFCSQSFPIALPTSCRDRKLDSRAEEGTGKRLCSQPFVYRISRNRSKCTKPHGDSDVSPCPPRCCSPVLTGALGWSGSDARCFSICPYWDTPQCSGQGRQERPPQTWSGSGNGSDEGNARTVSQRL